ncbi:MAG: hypothetical protein V1913_04045 [Fibrobacterota bacterium]
MKNIIKSVILLLMAVAILAAQDNYKFSSGEGLAFCYNANTHNKGDLWLNAFGRAFYWDNPDPIKGGFPLKIFPSGSVDYGILPYWDATFSMELLSYGFQTPGNACLKTKVTLPNNNKLRLFGCALSAAYKYSFVNEYASIGGYRNSVVGFYAEGLMMSGSSFEWRAIADVDFIRWRSFLPLKYYLNVGYRFSMADIPGSAIVNSSVALPEPLSYGQYLLFAGIEYKGLGTDFFLEFHMEILNSFKHEQNIVFFANKQNYKIFPYYFSENPMYLTPGIRIKYANGLTLMAALPITLSSEAGIPTGPAPPSVRDIPRVQGLPWSDGFSPFYPDWKLVGKISFPLHFTMSNSETIRKFLLMKNRGQKQTMDIDESIDKKDKGKGKDAEKTDEEKMKEDIEKRKKELMNEKLLE